jgi:hypothetical protein
MVLRTILALFLTGSLYAKTFNSSIPTGKSGGFRIILFKKVENRITLLSIYSKTEKENLTDKELERILDEVDF